jgi:hypothetical protein
VGLHERCPLLSDFTKNWKSVYPNFGKIYQYQIHDNLELSRADRHAPQTLNFAHKNAFVRFASFSECRLLPYTANDSCL